MLPYLQLLGLGLDAAGALLLAADAIGKFGMSAVEEAREEQDRYYGHFAGDDAWMGRDLQEKWLPPVVRRRRLRGGGATLLALGFLLQSIGLASP